MTIISNERYGETGVITGAAPSSKPSAVAWPAIIAGSVAAVTASVVLLALGSGLGLAVASPFSGDNFSVVGLGLSAASWLIVMQWLSSALGGYLTGRLRTRYADAQEDEVFFRDSAHGFLAWAVAALITVLFVASAATSVVTGAAKAVGGVAAGAAAGASHAAAEGPSNGPGNPMDYYADMMFRSEKPVPASSDREARMEAGRIFIRDIARDEFPEDDKAYLSRVIAAQSNLSQAEATSRIDQTIAAANEAKAEAKQAAETARKAAATFSIYSCISMLIGAFIASVAAIIGGRHRDDF